MATQPQPRSQASEQEIEGLASLFRALGDPARIRILSLLAQTGELSGRDVERITGYGASKVSRHFAYLKQAGFVVDRRDGLWSYYSLASATGAVRAKLDRVLSALPTFYALLAADAAKLPGAAETGSGTHGDGAVSGVKKRVLFLCQSNAARSQIAESFLRKYGGDQFEVHSAGLSQGAVHPLTRRVLEEAGIDTARLKAKGVDEYLGRRTFAYVITLCLEAEEECPRMFPGAGKILQWPFEDIANARLPEAEKLAKFRSVRDRIEQRVKDWLKD
jgi:arsenate reductase